MAKRFLSGNARPETSLRVQRKSSALSRQINGINKNDQRAGSPAGRQVTAPVVRRVWEASEVKYEPRRAKEASSVRRRGQHTGRTSAGVLQKLIRSAPYSTRPIPLRHPPVGNLSSVACIVKTDSFCRLCRFLQPIPNSRQLKQTKPGNLSTR
jgi:hypothetical protein